MQPAVRRRGLRAAEVMRLASKVRDVTTRFLDDQAAGRSVPWPEVPFPVGIQPPAGHVAEVQGRRSAPPDAATALEADLHVPEILGGTLAPIVGEARAEEGPGELLDGGHMDGSAVQLRAAAPSRRERLPPEWVVDEAEDEDTAVLQRDRDRAVRIAVGEVDRSVQWVDVPAILAPARQGRGLLRHDAMLWERRAQRVHDELLGLVVRGGDDVHRGCSLVGHRLVPAMPEPDQGAGASDRGARYPLEPPHAGALARASDRRNFRASC